LNKNIQFEYQKIIFHISKTKFVTLSIILTLSILILDSVQASSHTEASLTSPSTSNLVQTIQSEYQKYQSELEKKTQSNMMKGLRNGDIFANGGWNGSGGGGGYACFDNEYDLKNFSSPSDNIKADAYQKITNFHLLDLYLNTPVIWPGNESAISPRQFIEMRIRSRISPFFPILGQELFSRLNEIYNKSWSHFPVEYPIHDQWAEGTAIKPPPLCTYVTWVLRPQFVKEKTPVFFLAVNGPLENRLKQIFSPQKFEQQIATLKLHEAIYTILSHLGERNSNNTRGIIDIILKPDSPMNSKGIFLKLWLRGLNPLILNLSKDLSTMLKAQSNNIDHPDFFPQGIHSQIEWLEKLNLAYQMFQAYLAESHNGQRPVAIDVDDVERVQSKLYKMVVLFSITAIATSDNGKENSIHPRSAILFLNTILPLSEPHVSSEELSLMKSESSSQWKKVCSDLKLDSTKIFISEAMGADLKSVGDWVLNQALDYCDQSVAKESDISKKTSP